MKILRFSTGDAKAVLENTVRGADVYIIMDVGNYSCNYKMYGMDVASRSKLVDGKYPVEVHKYIGPDVEGKDILIVDDIIASGETILDVVKKVKKLGAKRVFIAATFGLFTEGIKHYNEAYSQGLFDAAFITNATYRNSSLIHAPWYKEVDISKYIAYYIYCVNSGKSISNILDPHKKIQDLLHKKQM